MEKDPGESHTSNFGAKVKEKIDKKQQKDEHLSVVMDPLVPNSGQKEPKANSFSKNTSKREEIIEDGKEHQGKHEETLSKQEALETTLPKSKHNIGDFLVPPKTVEHIIPKILDNEYMNKNFAKDT